MAHFEGWPGVVSHCEKVFEHFGDHDWAEWPLLSVNGVHIARPSVASLFLLQRRDGTNFGTATGFLLRKDSQVFLITNRHVVRGEQNGGKDIPPDSLVIAHNRAALLGETESREEPLYDDAGAPLWLEHPAHPEFDVAALPLTQTDGIDIYDYDPWVDSKFLFTVSGAVSIVGFPYGIRGGRGLAVWVRGFVATEPEADWEDRPVFLVDSRTRQGQSGSPVILWAPAGTMLPRRDQNVIIGSGGSPIEEFLGVYSGRINSESDLGLVWKPSVVRELIDGGQRARAKGTDERMLDSALIDEPESEYARFEDLTRKLVHTPKSAKGPQPD